MAEEEPHDHPEAFKDKEFGAPQELQKRGSETENINREKGETKQTGSNKAKVESLIKSIKHTKDFSASSVKTEFNEKSSCETDVIFKLTDNKMMEYQDVINLSNDQIDSSDIIIQSYDDNLKKLSDDFIKTEDLKLSDNNIESSDDIIKSSDNIILEYEDGSNLSEDIIESFDNLIKSPHDKSHSSDDEIESPNNIIQAYDETIKSPDNIAFNWCCGMGVDRSVQNSHGQTWLYFFTKFSIHPSFIVNLQFRQHNVLQNITQVSSRLESTEVGSHHFSH